jgi:membrane protease YdiL (CAAX protease family)
MEWRMEWLVVVAAVANIALQIWQDRRTYPRFKAMTETADRQRMYRFWVIDGVLRYGVLGLLSLYLIGHSDALLAMPADLLAARDALMIHIHHDPSEFSGIATLLGAALGGGVVLGGIAQFWMKPADLQQAVVGDIAALLPRNKAEMGWGAALSINAGFSEEVLFRLAVPLALFALTGNVLIAFGVSALLFGIVHAYQGWAGIVMTFIVGALLTLLYLASGNIWLVIGLHMLIDLRAMVLTPLALMRGGVIH